METHRSLWHRLFAAPGQLGRSTRNIVLDFSRRAHSLTRGGFAKHRRDPQPMVNPNGRETYLDLLNQSAQGVFIGRGGRMFYVNRTAVELFGYDAPEEIYALTSVLDLVAPGDRERLQSYRSARLQGESAPAHYTFKALRKDGRQRWVDATVTLVNWDDGPAIQMTAVDVTSRLQTETMLRGRTKVLEQLAVGAPLQAVLTTLVRAAEEVHPDMLCHVLLLDAQTGTLHGGVSISLPEAYVAAVNGLKIGPAVGSCGTAAYTGRRVIVEDVFEHPYWADYRDLATLGNVRACWSEPVRSSQGAVLGTLAMYYREPRAPDQANLEFIHDAGLLAGIAIERRQTEDALRRSRALLQTVVDTLPHTVFVKDLDDRYVFVNRAKADFHNMPPAEMIGKRVEEVPWGNVAELPAMVGRNRQVISTGQALETSEETITDLHGEKRFRHWYRLPLRNEQGEVTGLVSVSEDITARKKAEAALEESETRFRQVVDTLPTMLWLTGPNAETTFVNRPWLEYTGRTIEQHLGHGWSDNLHPDHRAAALESYLSCFNQRIPFGMEYRVRRYDGEYRWCLDTGRPRFSADGEFLGYVGTVVDIEHARQAHTQLVDAVESLPCAFMLFDASEKLLLWNQMFLKFFPFAAKFVEYGMPFERLVRGTLSQNPQFSADSWPTTANERIRQFRNPPTSEEYHLPDDRWFHAIDQRTSEGGTVTLHFDITEQKHRDAALLQSQKMDALGQLTGGVAHDFNNLLQVISGYSALALVGAKEDDHRTEPMRQVRDAAIRASNVVQQLLAFSRRQVVRAELLPLPLVLKNVASMLERLLGEHIELEVECDLATPEVLADQGMIEQVIVNLAVNARDAMPSGGTLRLETAERIFDHGFCYSNQWARPGRFAVITCADTGYGMTPEVKSRIFEPFFTTKETGKGTGLGLATVYGIVEQHQGFLNVESVLNQGTRFEVFLPVPDRAVESTAGPREETWPRGEGTILAVEDEPEVLRLLTRVLEDHGYRVIAAANGEEAIETFRRHQYDIDMAVLDLTMPHMGGWEACQRLRQLRPDLPTVLCTGWDREDVADEALRQNIPTLRKPYAPSALLQCVHEALRARQKAVS